MEQMELLLGLSFHRYHRIEYYLLFLLIYSNHGGRQVDTAPPAIECLQDIIKIVDGRAEGKFDL
jgi:hypothetical protein